MVDANSNVQNDKPGVIKLLFNLYFNILLIIVIIVLVNILRVIFNTIHFDNLYSGKSIVEIAVNILTAFFFMVAGWIFIAFFQSHSYEGKGPVGVTRYTINPGAGLIIGGIIFLFGIYIIWSNIVSVL